MKLLKNKLLKLLGVLALLAVVMMPQAFALPTLQAYLTGSTGTASGSVSVNGFSLDDADSWHLKMPAGELVGLTLQGIYSLTGVTNIENGFLVITVPDQQKLSMFFDLPNKGLVDNLMLQQNNFYYDSNTAFENYLANNFTLTGSPAVQLNNHLPLGSDPALVDVYAIPLDWLQSGFGTFQALTGQPLQDCNASANACTSISSKSGNLRFMNLGFNDVSWAHIDLVAKVSTNTKVNGVWVTESHFEMNPVSHDSTWQIPVSTPVILSVNPDPVTGSASQQTITINGTGFVNKPTVTLTWAGQSNYIVPAAQVNYVSSTQVQMSITTTTTPDNWTVKVTNPDGQSSNAASFAVIAPTIQFPTATSGVAQPNGATSAMLFGTVNPNGSPTYAWFEWGTSTSYGNASPHVSIGSGTSVVQQFLQLSNLTPGATYHFRMVSQNSGGTSYGNDLVFGMAAPTTIHKIVAGGWHSLALKSDGSVLAWGENTWGYLGDGTTGDKLSAIQIMAQGSGVVQLVTGDQSSLALKSDGSVWAWGYNAFGQLGDGTTVDKLYQVQVMVPSSGVTQLVMGNLHSLALKSDGSVWAWGDNNHSQLGDGTNGFELIPVQVMAPGSGVTQLVAGYLHSLALKSDGSVWAWGDNHYGQLGDGNTSSLGDPGQHTPIQVMMPGSGVTQLATGSVTSFAVKSDGSIWAWGYNRDGRLGDGTMVNKPTPVQVMAPGSGVTKLVTGSGHCLALKSDGSVWAWGINNQGQLGDGTTNGKFVPLQVIPPGSGVTQLVAGGVHSLALKSDGSVWAWGYNGYGALGDGTTTDRLSQVPVLLADGTALNLFTTSPSISHAIQGRVTGAGGVVTLNLTGTTSAVTTTTGAGETYAFPNVSDDTYSLTPSLTGYIFSPTSRNVTLTGANAIGQDFRACQTGVALTGVLRDATTWAVLPNITVTVDNAYTGSTDATGHYSIPGLTCGTHTVSVNVSGFTSYTDTLDTFNSWTRDISLTKNSTTQGLASLSGYSADPVNTATGNYVYQHRDMQLPGKGMPFVFERSYNSQAASNVAATSGPFGFGWTHNYNTSLTVDPSGNVTVNWGDGKTETYANNGVGGFTPQYGVFDTLITNAGGTYTLKKKDLTTYNFDAANHLASIVDKNSNTITLTYTSGNLTRVIDTAGRNIDFAYDASNRVVSIIYPVSRTVQFTYDAGGNLATAQDANGNITTYAYDASHQITGVTDPRGNVLVTNVYDATNRVVYVVKSQQDAKNGQTTYTYDAVSNKTTVVDQLGNTAVDYHDTKLRLIRQDDANGNSAFYEYDAAGNRIKVTDKNGKLTTYSYDANGNVTGKTDALGNTSTIFYDANNNPLIRTDALNNTTSFIYDAVGNLIRTTDALGNTASVTYDASGLPLTVTDARGNITTSTYDPLGNPLQVTNALGNVTTFTYDPAGRKISKRDALNRVTTYVYDNNDNPLSATDPLGQAVFSNYDGNNNRLTTIDKRGSITAFTYDVKDLLVSTTDALGNTVTTTYDALDRKIAVKDKRNNTTTFAYDGVGNSIQVTDAMGNATHFTYDGNGNRLSATDPLGHTSNFTYDALNRQISATDALGNFGSTTYDALGRVTSSINAKGQITSFAYDKLGRLVQVTDANSGTVNYAYDQNGNRISMTDPNGNVTTYAYDALNRLIAQSEPLGGITAYQYDAVGNQIQVTQPNGTSIHYAYDALDRLSNVTYPDIMVSLTYDANGNRIGMTDSLGASSYGYDPLNRMISATDSFGKTVTYFYDANGNRISLIYPGAKAVTYGYDVLNRLFIVSDWLTHSTTYAYDAAGRLVSSANSNGTTTSYGYDNANRLTGLSNTTGVSSIASYAYTLDAIGNHTQVTQNDPLPPVFTPGTVAYAYDADNRLNTAGSTANSFDANGNMTAKGTNTFAYDFENRLKQSTIGATVTQYGYNGTGDRLAKSNGSSITGYVLDTNTAISKVLAETDSSGTISAYYVYGMGLISRIQPNGTTSYYHYDSRGSTVALTDVGGAVTDKYAYDSFGKLVNSQGTTANPFKYLGQYGVMDEGNGLHYVRARFYDADAGRFINKDPKTGNDQDGQSLNRYVYAQNNPVRFVDVSGFSRLEVGGGQVTLSHSSDPDRKHRLLLEIQEGQKKLYEIEKQNAYLDAYINIAEAFKRASASMGTCLASLGFGCVKTVSDQALHALSVINGNAQQPTKTFENIGLLVGGESGQRIGAHIETGYSVIGGLKHMWELDSAANKMDSMKTNFQNLKDLFTKQTGPIEFVGDVVDAIFSK